MDCAIDVDSASAKILAEWDWKTQSSVFGGDHHQDSLLEPSGFGDHEQDSLHSNSPSQSSFDSMCSSPETTSSSNSCGLHQNAMDFSFGFPGGHHSAAALRAARTLARRHQHQSHDEAKQQKMSIKTRVKASEREKMRMRSLAEALHQLRDYLPPHYSKKGQPLTKIQTLKYTIDYINTLSDILDRA